MVKYNLSDIKLPTPIQDKSLQVSLVRSLSSTIGNINILSFNKLLFESGKVFDAASRPEQMAIIIAKNIREGLNLHQEHEEHWLMFYCAPIIVLRNIDHLFPNVSDLNIYRLLCNGEVIIFSLQNKQLVTFLINFFTYSLNLNCFKSALYSATAEHNSKNYEKGEIVFSSYPQMHWINTINAAIVCFPHWPEKDCSEVMQGVLFGRYLGDETGLFLNILHP